MKEGNQVSNYFVPYLVPAGQHYSYEAPLE